jgi:DNA-binding Lrp family transcriptional regulator
MTQDERDRLVALKKAKKKLITQRQAAEELGITERHVRRLLRELKRRGDQAVVHALRGMPSNRKIEEEMRNRAVEILSREVYRGFGPTLAAEHLQHKHGIKAGKETVRQWMMGAKLWRARKQNVESIHEWRARRSRFGELVQWDTSDHEWLEGRGERMKLIAMIDDATSRRFARFVRSDSTAENMNVLETYLRKYGRMVNCYTDRASLFQNTHKTRRGESQETKDGQPMPPTQIQRALRELDIVWIPAYSPQAKGRVERSFGVAQDRLVKGMRVAGVTTLEQANQYLEEEYLPWCNEHLAVAPANPEDAHRPLGKQHDLAAILSHVETRRVANDYTVCFEAKIYQIDRKDIRAGLRGGGVRVEKRRDGSVAVRFKDQYVQISLCDSRPKAAPAKGPEKPNRIPRQKSDWNKHFDLKKGPTVWQAAQASGRPTEESS